MSTYNYKGTVTSGIFRSFHLTTLITKTYIIDFEFCSLVDTEQKEQEIIFQDVSTCHLHQRRELGCFWLFPFDRKFHA